MQTVSARSDTTQPNAGQDTPLASEGINSLGWVLDEIRHALEESDRHLADQLAAGDGDDSMIEASRHWLHQASGALIMLDLDSVTDLVSHIAGLLTRVQDGDVAMSADLVSVVGRAYHALCEYLQELAQGAPQKPIYLYPYQHAILRLSGDSVAHPSDFLTIDPTGFDKLSFDAFTVVEPDDNARAALRTAFEAGLLALLRKPRDGDALARMQTVCDKVAGSSADAEHQRFWYLVGAWFRALASGHVTLDAAGKRLLTRLNSLVRKAVTGTASYPDSIQRDVLFCIACATAGNAELDQIQALFDLAGKVSPDYETPRYGMMDRRAIADGLAALAEMKTSWEAMLQQPGGIDTQLGIFKQGLSHFQDAIESLDEPGLTRMTGAWIGVVKTMGLESGPVSDALGVEVAVSLLFVEQLFNGGFNELNDVDARCSEMARRMDATLHDVQVGDETPQWLCDLSASVHERLTMGAFVVETRAAIREAEGALDSWSRDSSATDGVSGAIANFRQVSGVLKLFDYQHAASAAAYIADEVERLLQTDGVDFSTQDTLADSIGNLGFFIDGMAGHPERLGHYIFDEQTGAFSFDPEAAQKAADSSSDDMAPAVGSDAEPAQVDEPAVEPEAGSPAIDSELLEIFLAEAEEVLEQLAELSVAVRANSSSESVLTDIRRAFHTLKGSSRMVGLNDFGEAGWAMEELMNHWLASGQPASEALIELVDDSRGSFAQWVEQLQANPLQPVDPNALVARAGALQRGESAPVSHETNSVPATPDAPVETVLHADDAPLEQVQFDTIPSADDAPEIPESSAVVETPDAADAFLLDIDLGDATQIVLDAGGVDDQPVAAAATDVSADVTDTVNDTVGDTDPDHELPAASLFEGLEWDQPESVDATAVESIDPQGLEIDFSGNDDDAIVELTAGLESEPLIDIELGVVGQSEPESVNEPESIDEPESNSELLSVSAFADSDGLVDAQSQVAAPDPVETPATATPEATTEPEEAFAVIGENRVSRALFEVFVAEVDQLRAELVADAGDWHKDPARSASELALRGLHSLKGSASLVEAEPGRTLADHLEQFLIAQNSTGRNASRSDVTEYGRLLQVMFGSFREFAREQLPQALDKDVQAAADLVANWQSAAATPGGAQGANGSGPVAVASVAAPVDILDEFDAELLPLFVAEAEEYLPRIDQSLRAWQQDPGNSNIKQALMRELHTVKGSARMAGAMVLGQRVHEMETRVEQAITSNDNPAGLIDDLIAEQDVVSEQFALIQQFGVDAPPAKPVVPGGAESAPTVNADAVAASASELKGTTKTESADTSPSSSRSSNNGHALVRVRAEAIEKMVNEAGEVSITRARLDNSVGELRQVLNELTENVNRLRTQLRELEIQSDVKIQANETSAAASDSDKGDFDVLEFDRYTRFQELTRMLAESVNDVATVQQNASRYLDDAGQDLSRQATSMRQLQYHLMSIRMVQFGSVSDRLYRVVRQSAKALGKRVSLDILGSESEVDRNILETMVAPLEHLLRNSVSHGIESPADRLAAGKDEKGELNIDIRHDGNEIVLTLSDDGAGLNYDRIRERGISAGLIGADEDVPDANLADLIFKPGFSTSATIDQISGRGVGMDVVRAEVLGLGGRIEVMSSAGRGTTFVIHLPLTMAISQVMVAGVGDAHFAVPAAGIEKVLQLRPEELTAAYEARTIRWVEEDVPLYYLASLAGMSGQTPVAQPFSPVMIVRSGGRRIAVHADTVSKAQEVVVKNAGPQVARVDGVAGATVMGNGEVVLIINPAQLADNISDTELDAAMQAGMVAQLSDVPALVMVVDDSVTVRKVTQRLLTREGFDVLLAKDGVDALRQLQDQQPAIMLVDVEMPRMDGFDLTRAIRKESRYADIPIVMITSRTADKHKKFALSLGVNEFLGKPYIESNLVGLIRGYLGGDKTDSTVH